MNTRERTKIIKQYNNLTEDQVEGKKVIDESTITILTGKAGSGKTHLSIIYALEKFALERKRGGVNKIVITRPTAFRKKDNIGFLPGMIDDKFDPWIRPIKDIMYEIEGVERAEQLIKEHKVEIMPMMFTQGRTLQNSIIICDEAQNLDEEATMMLVTRLGKGSKMILCGDFAQSLLEKKSPMGIQRLYDIKDQVEGLGFHELTNNWRHPIIERIIELF